VYMAAVLVSHKRLSHPSRGAGLLRNVKGASLQKEGVISMLIFEWCVVAISLRTMKKVTSYNYIHVHICR